MDIGRDEGICLFELLAVHEVVQFGCEFRSSRSSSDDDPCEQGFPVCVAQSVTGSVSGCKADGRTTYSGQVAMSSNSYIW